MRAKKTILKSIKMKNLARKKALLKNELKNKSISLNIPNGLLKDTITSLKRGIQLNQIIVQKKRKGDL